MIGAAMDAFRQASGTPGVGLDVYLEGDVPIARGLGSSVTVRIGVLEGMNQLEGAPLEKRQLVQLAIEAEGHPDNAAPSALGGFVAAGFVNGEWRWFTRPIDERLRFVTAIPKKEIRTEDARRVMPSEYASGDVAHILNRSTLICAAMMTGEFAGLRGLFEDRMHQPYRASIFPEFPEIIDAGVAAGAIGGWLSGSGSTVICVTLENENAIADAMRGVAGDADIMILTADNHGMRRES